MLGGFDAVDVHRMQKAHQLSTVAPGHRQSNEINLFIKICHVFSLLCIADCSVGVLRKCGNTFTGLSSDCDSDNI